MKGTAGSKEGNELERPTVPLRWAILVWPDNRVKVLPPRGSSEPQTRQAQVAALLLRGLGPRHSARSVADDLPAEGERVERVGQVPHCAVNWLDCVGSDFPFRHNEHATGVVGGGIGKMVLSESGLSTIVLSATPMSGCRYQAAELRRLYRHRRLAAWADGERGWLRHHANGGGAGPHPLEVVGPLSSQGPTGSMPRMRRWPNNGTRGTAAIQGNHVGGAAVPSQAAGDA